MQGIAVDFFNAIGVFQLFGLFGGKLDGESIKRQLILGKRIRRSAILIQITERPLLPVFKILTILFYRGTAGVQFRLCTSRTGRTISFDATGVGGNR